MRLNPLALLAILPLAACSHAGGSTALDAAPAPAPVADAAHECKPEALEASPAPVGTVFSETTDARSDDPASSRTRSRNCCTRTSAPSSTT